MANNDYQNINKYSSLNSAAFFVTVAWIGLFLFFSFGFLLNILASAEGGGYSFKDALKVVIFEFAILAIYPVARCFFYYSFFKINQSAKVYSTTEWRPYSQNIYKRAKTFAIISLLVDLFFIPICFFTLRLGIEYLKH